MTEATPDPVAVALFELDSALCRLGVPRAQREEMSSDVVQDLRAAAEDGVDPRSLFTPDVDTFAREVSSARGVSRVDRAYPQAVAGAIAGASAVFLLGWPIAIGVFTEIAEATSLGLRDQGRMAIAAHSLLALLSLGGALVAMGFVLRPSGAVRETLVRAAALLPLAALVITPVTISFARVTGYSTHPTVLVIEMSLIVGAATLAVVSARRSAVLAKVA